jgi:putative FmdB family regulatory protein
MPRYNYKCQECDKEIELVHSMAETASDCPECTAKNVLIKQLSVPRINKSKVPKTTGSVVKSAISEYKERVATEKGIWGEIDIEEIVGENKK